jgi:hypothetical protein
MALVASGLLRTTLAPEAKQGRHYAFVDGVIARQLIGLLLSEEHQRQRSPPVAEVFGFTWGQLRSRQPQGAAQAAAQARQPSDQEAVVGKRAWDDRG